MYDMKDWIDEGKAVKRRGGDWHVLIATDWEIVE